MRRTLALVMVFIATTLSTPVSAVAEVSCPNLWTEKLPPLTLQKSTVTKQEVSIDYLETNFGGIDNVSTGIKGGQDSSDSRNNATLSLPIIAPELYARISALGRDVVWSTEYSVDSLSKYKSFNIGGSKIQGRDLRWMGISDGTKITFKVNVAVKGCATFIFESNVANVPQIDTKELTLTKYYDIFYSDWNYIQIQNLNSILQFDIDATKNAKINERVMMKAMSTEHYSPIFVGVSPGGCVDSISDNIPSVNPTYLIFNTLPCTVGIYMGGQFKDKSFGSPLVSTFTVSGPKAEELKAAAELKAKQEAEAKAAAELKAKQDAAVKAAAELKAKQEADAKAAAELKAKQEAAADKAALTRAQSELTSANAALADAQKVNREQAARITSFEEQFKVLSESVATVQSQLSQLNSKLVAALAGQKALNAKLKKVCSAKPKPKGC
jgi:hypothetical protein